MIGRLSFLLETFDLTPLRHGQLNNRILEERGKYHQSKRVQRHFNRNQWTSPGGPYRYTARSERTIKRKRRKGVDPYRPNVMTGEMYKLVQSNGNVTSTQHRWSWRTRGTPKRPLPDWQRREVEAISTDEINEDIEFIGKRYAQLAVTDQYRRLRRRRIKG